MKHQTSQALFAYWHSLCRDRSAPDRHDLDPSAMRGLLAYTFMLEVHRSETVSPRCSIRLSGTRLDALFGRELKGSAFADLFGEEGRGELGSVLDAVLGDTQPVVAGLQGAPVGYEPSRFEMLLLPLRHHGQTHSRLLGCLVPNVMPTWMGLRPMRSMALQSWRAVDRDAGAMSMDAADQRRGLRRAHLMVYEGGRDALGAPVSSQVCVKTHVSTSLRPFLSTRRS